jgi:hypothetical protein
MSSYGPLADVLVMTNNGAPSNGTTGAGVLPPGSLVIDVDNFNVYVNSGTKASPSFSVVSLSALSSAELGYIDGVTAGTATASKALVLGTSKQAAGLGILSIGVKADTAISNVALSAATPRGFAVFVDDAGANIGDDVKCLEGRVLLTHDQTGGSIRGVMGHVKMLTGIDVTSGIYAGVQGYLELAATHSAKTGSTLSCIDASLEIGTALTVDSGGEVCGIHVETTGAGTLTNSGTCAGILVDKASGAASWPDGIFIDGPSVIMGMRIGKFAGSAATTSAVLFATTQNVYGDGQLSTLEVNGASSSNLTSAYAAKCGRFRHVANIGTHGDLEHETYGVMGQMVVKESTLKHLHAGVIGTFEGHTSGVIVNSAYAFGAAAVLARVGGGAAITATTDLSGVSAFWNGAALASGSAAAFSLCDSGTAPWTNALALSRATNLLDLPAAGTDPVIANALVPAAAPTAETVGADACLRVLVNNVAFYIPLYDTLHG